MWIERKYYKPTIYRSIMSLKLSHEFVCFFLNNNEIIQKSHVDDLGVLSTFKSEKLSHPDKPQ